VAGLRTLDPLVDIDAVMGGPRKVSGEYALSNSFGFGGANASLVLAGAAS
jgi:3-oxoacyl-[acyl-carrier-protein] synthase II